MALGDLPKQLVVDALRPTDLPKISELLALEKPSAPGQPDNLGATILGQIQAMQRALKDDQELLILCTTGTETVRVLEVFVPAWHLFVLTGIDTQKTITRVISPVESTQLVCKVVKVQAPAQPTRIRFVAPKPKPE